MADGDRCPWQVRHRSKIGDSEPGDEQGMWTREQIERMDAEFVSAMQRAIRNGDEHVTVAHARPSSTQDT
jgi:hypothetical protein